MVSLTLSGRFPAPLERVWRLLDRHRDDAPSIHPAIRSQRILEEEGEVRYDGHAYAARIVFERTWHLGRREWTAVWRYLQAPPETFRVELVGGEQPLAAGSYWENSYRADPNGTQITTHAEITFHDLKVPSFLQAWAIRRSLNQADREDVRYLMRYPP